MKHLKKMMALVIAMVMVLSMTSMVAFAAPQTNAHTITITNTDQNVTHTYEAYKVFSGNLDAEEKVLSDIAWADGVNGTAIQAALVGSTEDIFKATSADITDGKDVLGKAISVGDCIFKNCTSAQDVARVLGKFQSTAGAAESAGRIDAVASIIAANLATKTADFTQDASDATKYTADVVGDGYYFIKDTTTDLTNDDKTSDKYKGSDTLSKYLLAVIKDTTIVAKDTGILPDKKILGENNTKLAAGTKAVGDTDTFVVTIAVPNTRKYDDHFVFVMNDKLPAGITFTGITSVVVGTTTLTDTAKANPAPQFDSTYSGSAGYYTLKVDNAVPAKDTTETTKYTFEASSYDAVTAAGGQAIEITFNEFKKFIETNNLDGQTVTITYTGVINDDADYTPTGNENEVTFSYSNDPNNDYDGDNFDNDDPKGVTPKSTTITYTTSLKIKKVDENGTALEGATFELKGNSLNRTVLTGSKFELTTYTPVGGETVDTSTTYWELLDGSFTDTDPTSQGINDTQYVKEADGSFKEYYKVTYNKNAVSAKTTDIDLVTDASGVAEFTGITEGNDYTLEEIAAPDGYNKIDGKIQFSIIWGDPESTTTPAGFTDAEWATAKTQGGYLLKNISTTSTGFAAGTPTWNATDKQFVIQVENKSGTELPSTGGIGTTIFYVIGAILVLGAGILLVTRRRMNAN